MVILALAATANGVVVIMMVACSRPYGIYESFSQMHAEQSRRMERGWDEVHQLGLMASTPLSAAGAWLARQERFISFFLLLSTALTICLSAKRLLILTRRKFISNSHPNAKLKHCATI